MAQQQIASPWALRIDNADRYYKAWESKFRCVELENYYEGFQWKFADVSSYYRPYTLNLIYSTIEDKLASILYQNPEFVITPKPGNMDWDIDFAVESAQIKQDTLNTIVANPNLEFTTDLKLCALDSYFRFAVMEIGYAGDWQNPNKTPVTTENWEDPSVDPEDAKVISDPELPVAEHIYSKWISAKQFRVSVDDAPKLRNTSWCGYFEFIPRDILQKTPGIKFPDDYTQKYYSPDYVASSNAYFLKDKLTEGVLGEIDSNELCKVWRIWDNRLKKKYLLLDGNFEVLWEDTFERLPFATHRHILRLKGGWYPIPPVFHWTSSQDEINQSREQMRNYRRRFTRKFEYTKGTVTPDELDKFKSEIDGEVIEVKSSAGQAGIRAIGNPEVGISITEGLIVAKDDFNIMAGTSLARGRASDRQTATATREISQEEKIRESAEQINFNKFIIATGREMLLQAGERLALPVWIKWSADPGEDILGEINSRGPIWRKISASQIEDGYDFEVNINVTDAVPARMAEEEMKFVKFLTLVTKFPQVALSPRLIRETAYRVGYRNERIIKEMQQMALLAMFGNMVQTGGGNATNMERGMIEQQMSNSPGEIESQLQNQVG